VRVLKMDTTKLARQTRPPAETIEPRGEERRGGEAQETEYGDWKDCIPSTSCTAQHHHHHTAPQQHHMDQLGPCRGHGSARWHIGEESLRIPGPTRAAFSAQEQRDWTGWLLKAPLLGHSLTALAAGGICRLGVDGRGRRHRLKHGLPLCHGLKHRLRDEHAVDAAWRPNRRGETGIRTTRVQEDGLGWSRW
jgi:hypothetical protein